MTMPLTDAAASYFLDPDGFLAAFECDPYRTILALRDDPGCFGKTRSYVGKQAIAAYHKRLLAAARREFARVSSPTAARSTRRRATRP